MRERIVSSSLVFFRSQRFTAVDELGEHRSVVFARRTDACRAWSNNFEVPYDESQPTKKVRCYVSLTLLLVNPSRTTWQCTDTLIVFSSDELSSISLLRNSSTANSIPPSGISFNPKPIFMMLDSSHADSSSRTLSTRNAGLKPTLSPLLVSEEDPLDLNLKLKLNQLLSHFLNN